MNNTAELQSIVHVDETAIGCSLVADCIYKERSLSYAIGVTIPDPGNDPDEIFKECCYKHYIFADTSSSNDFKNDYSSFFHQRQLSTETVDFILYHYETDTEYPLNNDDYGFFFGFGYFESNIDLKGYLVQWKSVLDSLGAGNYQIIKRVNIAGIDYEVKSVTFTLRQYSSALADRTVRMDVVMNGLLEEIGVDFTDTNWRHSVRVPGFFGRREPTFEEDNLIRRNYDKQQISMKQTNEYQFQTNLIPDCLTDEIIDFFMMANDIFMNDYNLNNHSYKYVKFPVKVESNSGTTYGVKTRKAQLNYVFSERKLNKIKRNFK